MGGWHTLRRVAYWGAAGGLSFRASCEKVGVPFAWPQNHPLDFRCRLWYKYFCSNRQVYLERFSRRAPARCTPPGRPPEALGNGKGKRHDCKLLWDGPDGVVCLQAPRAILPSRPRLRLSTSLYSHTSKFCFYKSFRFTYFSKIAHLYQNTWFQTL